MRVMIVADGTVRGTKVMSESGVDITDQIEKFELSQVGGDIPRATLHLHALGWSANTEAAFAMRDPRDGVRREVRRIEFTDGTVFEASPEPEPTTREADDGA